MVTGQTGLRALLAQYSGAVKHEKGSDLAWHLSKPHGGAAQGRREASAARDQFCAAVQRSNFHNYLSPSGRVVAQISAAAETQPSRTNHNRQSTVRARQMDLSVPRELHSRGSQQSNCQGAGRKDGRETRSFFHPRLRERGQSSRGIRDRCQWRAALPSKVE